MKSLATPEKTKAPQLRKVIPYEPYEIIYADPPWDYTQVGKNFGHNITKTKDGGFRRVVSAADHYPTMKVKELLVLPVRQIAAPNSLLFIWTTGPMLDVCLDIIKAWGFKYKTFAFVWDKLAVMPGSYTMSQYEYCLVAKHGNIPKPRGERNIRQRIIQQREEHSVKPVEARIRINKMFPQQRKIELFARSYAEGWDVWGNEVISAPHISEVFDAGNS